MSSFADGVQADDSIMSMSDDENEDGKSKYYKVDNDLIKKLYVQQVHMKADIIFYDAYLYMLSEKA